MPFSTNLGLVTNRSSPTTWIFFPTLAVNFLNPSQSFSYKGSSIETIGYFLTHCDHSSIISSVVLIPVPESARLYFPSSYRELAAGSSAMKMSLPAL